MLKRAVVTLSPPVQEWLSRTSYIRRNFLCGLQGREPSCLSDLNNEMREWVWAVVNQRVHETTHEQVASRWEVERRQLQPLNGLPSYPYIDEGLRKVAQPA